MSNVPDYRAMFLRGHGSQDFNSGGYGSVTHSSGAIGSVQGDTIRNIHGSVGDHRFDGWIFKYTTEDKGAFYTQNSHKAFHGTDRYNTTASSVFGIDASKIVPTGNENRPVNKAVKYLIRAQ